MEFNNNIVDNKEKKSEIISKNEELKIDTDKIRLGRDIYIHYLYLKKINEYVKKTTNLSYLSKIGNFNSNPSSSNE